MTPDQEIEDLQLLASEVREALLKTADLRSQVGYLKRILGSSGPLQRRLGQVRPCSRCGRECPSGRSVILQWKLDLMTAKERFPKSDWRCEVTSGDTKLGYDEWLEHRLESEYDDMKHELESGECAVIRCNGFKTTATFDGKHLATGDFDDLLVAIKEEMEFRKFWPDIYYINDHGNVSLLDHKGNTIRDWV